MGNGMAISNSAKAYQAEGDIFKILESIKSGKNQQVSFSLARETSSPAPNYPNAQGLLTSIMNSSMGKI